MQLYHVHCRRSQQLVRKSVTNNLFIHAIFLLWYITFLHVLCHDMPLHISKTVKFLTT